MDKVFLSPNMSVTRSITSSGVIYCLNVNGKYFQGYTSLDALMRDMQAIIEGVLIPEAVT